MSAELLLGLGGTVDYEVVWDAAVLERLAREHGILASELDASVPVVDVRSLVVSVLAFLRDGRGGEKFVASTAVLEEFASHFAFATTLGGTCVRAALVLAEFGIPSMVHLVSIDDTVRRHLPPAVSYVCSASGDSTDPHVIVQYPRGTVIRLADAELIAPHPNRLIYVNDLPNRDLVLVPELSDLVSEARIFLASGFNTIQDAATLDDRVARVVEAIERRPAGAIAIFEDAGTHDPALGRRVRDAVSRVVDVYGMNEDELFGYLGAAFDLLDPVAVEQALARAAVLIPASVLVVHTKHWALAITAADGAPAARWRAALEGGVTIAATRFRVGDALSMRECTVTRSLPRQLDALACAAELEKRLGPRVAVVPAFALDTAMPTTIGLGDSFVGGFIAALDRELPWLPGPGEARA